MYVRLKHTLSALALEALRGSRRSGAAAAAAWLAAYCDLADKAGGGDGAEAKNVADRQFDLPLAAVAARADRSAAGPAGLSRLLDAGLLVRRTGMLSLPNAFRPHFAYMRRHVTRLQAALGDVHRGADLPGEDVVRKGAALFNAGLFFESHEFFEDVWRKAPAEDRDFYQGLILIAAAFYHYEKKNLHGAGIKLTQGLKNLKLYPPTFHGIHLARWADALAPWRARIEAGHVTGVLKPSEIPSIPLSRASASAGRC